MYKGLVILSAVLLIGTQESFALESFQYYRGVRGLGMGGATLAVVNDETALAVNPAGLGKLRNFFGTLIDPEVETNGLSQGVLVKGQTGAFTDTDELAANINANTDKYFYSRVQFFPSIVVRNFGLGLLYTQENYGISDSLSATMDLVSRTDMSYLTGYSFRFWDGRIKLGFTAKYIQRSIVSESDLNFTTTPTPSTLVREGSGLGFDTGLLLTAPWRALPALGVVVKDLGGTKFDLAGGANLPEEQKQSVDVGLSISPIHSRGLRSQWTVEYRDALNAGDATGQDKVHFGTEFNFSDLLFLRAGMYQRYWTLGSEFSTEYFQIQFATYAVNIGTSAEPEENRRYVAKFGVRF